jgi:hypothetical protein
MSGPLLLINLMTSLPSYLRYRGGLGPSLANLVEGCLQPRRQARRQARPKDISDEGSEGLSDETLGSPDWKFGNLWSSANFRRLRLEIEFMQNASAGYSTCEDEKKVCGVKILVSTSSPIRV